MLRSVLVRFDLVDRPDGGANFTKNLSQAGRSGRRDCLSRPVWNSARFSLVARKLVADHLDHIVQLLPAMLIVFLTEFWTISNPCGRAEIDRADAGASWAYFAGVQITGIAGHAAAHWWSFPMTVAWLVICTNAFNLIDGVDGLAVGIGSAPA